MWRPTIDTGRATTRRATGLLRGFTVNAKTPEPPTKGEPAFVVPTTLYAQRSGSGFSLSAEHLRAEPLRVELTRPHTAESRHKVYHCAK